MVNDEIKMEKHTKGTYLELKSCPFCGEKEDLVYIQYEHAAGKRWKIMCCGCCAEIDPGWAQEKSVVTDIWNKRTEESK